MFYEQEKFNLFIENNEGYAKLMVELLDMKNRKDIRVLSDKQSKENKMELEEKKENSQLDDVSFKNILSLVGFFDLDPERVVDTILSSLVIDC
jgi:THO complex subunit 2